MTSTEFVRQLLHLPQVGAAQEQVCAGTAAVPLVVTDAVDLRGRHFDLPVRIEHVHFTHAVDLSELTVAGALRIEHCTFNAGLTLRDANIEGLFIFRACTIEKCPSGWLDGRRLRVGGLTDFTLLISAIALDFSNMVAGDDLRMDGLSATATLTEQNYQRDVLTPTDREYVRKELLGKALNLEGADIRRHVYIKEAQSDSSTLTPAVLNGTLDLRAKIGGSVGFDGTQLTASLGESVLMQSANIGGSVFVKRCTCTGKFDLRATVGSTVEFANTELTAGTNGVALTLESATVAGAVFFMDGTTAEGKVDLRAVIGGTVEFQGATLTAGNAKDGVALTMEGAEVHDAVYLRDGSVVHGTLNLDSAKFQNGFYATREPNKQQFTLPAVNQSKQLTLIGDLNLSYTEIHGPMQFHEADLWGMVNARHLTVHGDVDFCGCRFGPSVPPTEPEIANLKKQRITWQQCEIARTANAPAGEFPLDFEMSEMRGRFWAKQSHLLGTLNLEDAEIDGEANFDGATVNGHMLLRSAVVKGRVFADEQSAAAYPQVTGRVDLSYSTLAQVDMRFTSSELTPDTVDLTGATVGTLQLSGPVHYENDALARPYLLTEGLKFEALTVDEFEPGDGVPPESWRDALRVGLFLAGSVTAFILAAFQNHGGLMLVVVLYGLLILGLRIVDYGRQRGDVPNPLLGLLKLTYPFSRSFYIRVEKWLRDIGDDATADEVFLLRRRREARPVLAPPAVISAARLPTEQWPDPKTAPRLWRGLIDFAMGYGVRTRRLVHVFVLLLLINTGIFLNPAAIERPIAYTQKPIKREVAEKLEPSTGRGPADAYWQADGGQPLATEWGAANAFFMALRVQVPLLTLGAENDWEPASREMLGRVTYEEYASLMSLVNLVLIPLLLAGLTGFLKK